jgi:hypothetical protein
LKLLLTICLFFVLGISQAFAQFFVQKLPQDKIQFAEEAYMLLSTGRHHQRQTWRSHFSQWFY